MSALAVHPGGVFPPVVVDGIVAGRHDSAVSLEQAHGVLPHRRGDHAKVEFQRDAQIAAGAFKSPGLGDGQGRAGGPWISREDDPRVGGCACRRDSAQQ